MASTKIQIGENEHATLKRLAKRTGQPIGRVLSAAIIEYQRKVFWEQVNAGCSKLHANPKAARQVKNERFAWDVTLADGLEKGLIHDRAKTGLFGL